MKPPAFLVGRSGAWIYRAVGMIVVAVFAAAWAAFVLGPVPLDVHDTHWIWGDLAQVHIAWQQYLSDPDVHWLSSTRLSYPQPLSISLFDPMPLLLLLARPFAALADPGTQYFGYYFMFCLVLQGVFGYFAALSALRLAGVSKGVSSVIVAALTGILFASIPYTFYRFQGHTALSSHWVLVLSIWVALAGWDWRGARWYVANCAVVFVATGLNPYLALLVCASTSILALLSWKVLGLREIAQRVAAVAIVAALGLSLFGFMDGSNAYSGGYGVYSMNLLGPFDSNGVARLLPLDVPDATTGQSFEGYTYVGLGILMLVLLALLVYVNHRAEPNRFPFAPALGVVVCCSLLALSATVTLASHVVEIPIPKIASYLLSRFRGSGRLFWMAGFWLVMISVVACSLRFGTRRAVVVLALLVMVQIVDIRSIGSNVRTTIASANALRIAGVPAGSYSALLVFPAWQCDNQGTPGGGVRNYEAVGQLAASLGIPTNNFYAARTPAEQSVFHCDYDARLKQPDARAVYLISAALMETHGGRLRETHVCSPLEGEQGAWKCMPKQP